MNQFIYNLAAWLDNTAWSTRLHESFYLYNWIETTHVLTLMISLGLLLLVDLRMLGLALTGVPANRIAQRLQWPMLLGFGVMLITGALLFYAIPVRSAQSLWFRIKFLLLICAAVNALLFHAHMRRAGENGDWALAPKAPAPLRHGAALSILFWVLVVICGRLIAYDWYDCAKEPSPVVAVFAGCIDGQERF